jgi:beta-barrel assembly-enhancing protease
MPALSSRYRPLLLVAVPALVGSCAAPMTQMGAVSEDQVKAEQLKQQQLVLESEWKFQQRLESVAYPLLKGALPLCGDHMALRSGINFATVHAYKRDWHAAARAAGLSDTVSVVGVVQGSGAERAGIKPGDRIIELAGSPVPAGPTALREVGNRFTKRFAPVKPRAREGNTDFGTAGTLTFTETTLPLVVKRDTTTVQLDVPMDTACGYGVIAKKDDVLNAFADGRNIYVTSSMMRFATEEGELETVVAHEIAHNAMRHIDAQRKNVTLGAIFGAMLDVAAASYGVNTGGEFTNQMAALAAMTFSQEFEREADYVGLYILARAGRPIRNAPNLWRRMATESPGSIKFASTHPTTAERYVRLEQGIQEIEKKQAEGAPLLPEMKNPKKQ